MIRPPVGIGLAGCGWIAELAHLPTLRSLRSARLVAAADHDPARRDAVARQVADLRLYSRWQDLLSDPAVEAVLIALPTALHAEAALQCFNAGKHVYLEKPVAAGIAEGLEVLRAWRRAGTVGTVGYNFRRNPVFEAAARRVAAGELGELISIQASFQWAAERIDGWRARPEAGGGVLLDLVSHHADLVTVLAGEPIMEVRASVRSLASPDDTAALQVSTGGGMIGHLVASFAAGANVNRLDLIGREGALRVDLLEPQPSSVERRPGRLARVRRLVDTLGLLRPGRLVRPPGWEPSFGRTLAAFVEGVQSGVPTGPDVLDGLRAVAVVDAALVSARAGGGPVQVRAFE